MTASFATRSPRVVLDTAADHPDLPAGNVLVRVVGITHRAGAEDGATAPRKGPRSPARHIPAHVGTDDGGHSAVVEDLP